MKQIFLSLGSNKGNRKAFLQKAIFHLEQIGNITKRSSIYKTAAYGEENQNDFYNCVIEFHCSLQPEKLLEKIKEIEYRIGREKTYHWGPREIDIDILFIENINMQTENLTIPHKEFSKRNFVLTPWKEIAPNCLVENKLIQSYYENCTDSLEVEKCGVF